MHLPEQPINFPTEADIIRLTVELNIVMSRLRTPAVVGTNRDDTSAAIMTGLTLGNTMTLPIPPRNSTLPRHELDLLSCD